MIALEMDKECRRKKQLAFFTSAVLNPFVVGLSVMVFLSFSSTSSVGDGLKWSLLLIGFTVLPVFLLIIYLVHKDRIDDLFIRVREQRNQIYLLACLCIIACCALLFSLQAPMVLFATMVAALSAMLIFMVINFTWKISLHTAFAAGSVTVLTLLYGSTGALSAVLVPPIAWSRIELKYHSLAQTVAGALLSALIVFVVFHLFGLIGEAAAL
jgi:membrane-associated phospholipid phosphatase